MGNGVTRPEDLSAQFVLRANAGDADALAALYAEDAVLALGPGERAEGRAAIRAFYSRLLASRPQFVPGEVRPALIAGALALTSTRLADGTVTAEVARRQPDGTWAWVLDDPALVGANDGKD